MMGRFAWLKVVVENRRTIFKLVKEAFFGRKARPRGPTVDATYQDVGAPEVSA